MIRKEFLATGKIQKVGFRYFVKLNALELNLTGSATNLNNGNVLIEIQGISENIEKLKNNLFKGNGFCKVISLDEKIIKLKDNETKFNIY